LAAFAGYAAWPLGPGAEAAETWRRAVAKARVAAEKITSGAPSDLLPKKRMTAVTGCYAMCAQRTNIITHAGNVKHVCGQYQATS
jgi:uncharacterized membrane protein YccC